MLRLQLSEAQRLELHHVSRQVVNCVKGGQILRVLLTLDPGGEVENDALFEFACVHSEREN